MKSAIATLVSESPSGRGALREASTRWGEADTKISMSLNGHGRQSVRTALQRLRQPYEPIRGEGIRLSSPETAMTILRGRFIRVDHAVIRADKTQRELQQRHLEQMNPQDQQRMMIAAGFFGAIRTLAKQTTAKLLK